MGLGPSKPDTEYAQVLLLGLGKAGKTTLLKQLNLRYGNGFTAEEKHTYKHIVYSNMLADLQQALYLSTNYAPTTINPQYSLSEVIISRTLNTKSPQSPLEESPMVSLDMRNELLFLLADPGVNPALAHQLKNYKLDLLQRITRDMFDPTLNDMLLCYTPTLGSTVQPFLVADTKFKIVDVGGTQNSRSEWQKHYESSNVIVWVVDLLEYDTPRLAESLRVFASTVNDPRLINKPVVVVFTHYDQLAEKFASVSTHISFPDFKGPHAIESFDYFVWTKFKDADKHVGNSRLTRTVNHIGEYYFWPALIKVIADNHPATKVKTPKKVKFWVPLDHKESVRPTHGQKRPSPSRRIVHTSSHRNNRVSPKKIRLEDSLIRGDKENRANNRQVEEQADGIAEGEYADYHNKETGSSGNDNTEGDSGNNTVEENETRVLVDAFATAFTIEMERKEGEDVDHIVQSCTLTMKAMPKDQSAEGAETNGHPTTETSNGDHTSDNSEKSIDSEVTGEKSGEETELEEKLCDEGTLAAVIEAKSTIEVKASEELKPNGKSMETIATEGMDSKAQLEKTATATTEPQQQAPSSQTKRKKKNNKKSRRNGGKA